MGRGSTANSANETSSHTAAHQLLFGQSRSGTRMVKLSALEQAELQEQAEITAYIAQGGVVEVDAEQNRVWRYQGRRHRLNGPAVERADGRQEWFDQGQRHRLSGPAIEYPVGHKEWWVKGVRHRLSGPAIEYKDGRVTWYLNDQRYDDEQAWLQAKNER